ncbi:aminopeptidase [Sphingomonas sinipercae]|uniref:Aminopeptidase n=1 Tax=Sphingomonas sinipercae TaxID=2714944 RepID=A0A6G7ZM21_9SPHN|nr:M1 family aminopeptidase [Sphingomonas sinipercae]QIL01972.1 aminopeptidase [Sphingomonas sinipercae]
MFARIAAFEFRYLLKNPLLWMTAAVVFLMPFASLALGLGLEEDFLVFKNSPYEVISKYRLISCLFMFATTVFVSNIVLRDDETEFGPILRSTGITKFDYLFGRFFGALAVVALCLALVSVGIWLGSVMPWIDQATVGPNRIGDHLYAYFLIGLPNVVISASVFFAVATISRSMMGTYLGLVVFLGLYLTLLSLLGGSSETIPGFAIAEPFSARAFNDAIRYWTTPERNSMLPDFSGALLYNRLLWLGISAGFLATAYFGFDFATRRGSRRRRKQTKMARLAADDGKAAGISLPHLPSPQHGPRATLALLAVRTRFEMKQVLKSPAFILLMAWATITTLFVLITQRDPGGRPAHPVTVTMMADLRDIFQILPILVVVIYAGELVWRERDRRMHEIVDAAPHPNWAYVVPKMAAIAAVLFSMFVVSAIAAIATQLALGFPRIEAATYLLWYVLPMTWDALLVAALTVFIQTLTPHKFVGWGVMALYIGAKFTGYTFAHHLLDYASTPPTPYSDMDGISSFWQGPLVFRLYWGALAALLLVAAHLLWRRGTDTRLKSRLRLAPGRLKGGPRLVAGGALLTFAATGAFAYYNTNILNRYETPEASDAYSARYEKKYLKFAKIPQPSVADVKLDVALYPHQRLATVQGSYLLRNLTGQPISDVHVRVTDRGLVLKQAEIAGGRLAMNDAVFGYRIYRLDRPMAPGESRVMRFATERHHRGFANGTPNTRIVDNGTFLSNSQLLPLVGVRTQPMVQDAAVRREFGLPKLGRAPLEDESAAALPADEASWVNADIQLSTSADQTPVAPGRKVSDSVRGGRRIARFVSEAPIRNSFAVQSAHYAERHRQYRGIDLAVYYHPAHAWNVGHMLDTLQTALDYYQANFGPYQFSQARIVEFPSYQFNYAQAFAGTIPNAESLGFLADLRSPEALDYVSGNVAHEMAHQYWGHQITPAAVQGSLLLVESLAQYSAIMVVKHTQDEAHLRRLLRAQLDNYLSGRAWDQHGEVPLARLETQQYLMYNKGPLALYLLQQRLGEAAVNRALRSLLDRFRFKSAPYPRSVDLIGALRAQAKTPEQQALITDLFERITLYDLKVTGPTARRRADGKWEVTVPIQARKFYADAAGAEKEAPLSDAIEIGVFTADPGSGDFTKRDVVLLERRPLESGRQIVKFVVDRKPVYAGVDPYAYYIDRNVTDNVVEIATAK